MQDLIDIGANLTHDSFDADRDAVIGDAVAAGVSHMVVTGSGVEESEAAATMAASQPGLLSSTAGIHPHHAKDFEADSIARLESLLALDEVRAVGECGLDYFRNFSPRDVQLEVFEAQLDLATRTGLPVFLHQRDAHEDFMAVLKPVRDRLSRAVAHCFTGTREELYACLDLDLHVGITGWICDERRGLGLREIVADIPPDRLMIETDAPYLLPRDLDPKPKSRRNEPKYLPHVLARVAEHAGRSAADVAVATTRTARQFFALPGGPERNSTEAV